MAYKITLAFFAVLIFGAYSAPSTPNLFASTSPAPTTTTAATTTTTTTTSTTMTTTMSTKVEQEVEHKENKTMTCNNEEHERHYDGLSFFGGILLTVTVSVIGFFVYRKYHPRGIESQRLFN